MSWGNLFLAACFYLALPILYAVAVALIIKGFGISIPLPLSRTIEIAANGAIPAMIILLGLELTRIEWTHSLRATGLSVPWRRPWPLDWRNPSTGRRPRR